MDQELLSDTFVDLADTMVADSSEAVRLLEIFQFEGEEGPRAWNLSAAGSPSANLT
jgi:hypothetical protein